MNDEDDDRNVAVAMGDSGILVPVACLAGAVIVAILIAVR